MSDEGWQSEEPSGPPEHRDETAWARPSEEAPPPAAPPPPPPPMPPPPAPPPVGGAPGSAPPPAAGTPDAPAPERPAWPPVPSPPPSASPPAPAPRPSAVSRLAAMGGPPPRESLEGDRPVAWKPIGPATGSEQTPPGTPSAPAAATDQPTRAVPIPDQPRPPVWPPPPGATEAAEGGPAAARPPLAPLSGATAAAGAAAPPGEEERGGPPAAPPAAAGALPVEPPAVPNSYLLGVLLFLGGVLIFGSVIGLLLVRHLSYTADAVICGGAFLVLGAFSALLRGGPAIAPLRGTLATVAVLFVPAVVGFADDLSQASAHDTEVKLLIAVIALAVAALLASVFVPSAVAGGLAALAIGASIVVAVLLAVTANRIEIAVAAGGWGLALALISSRVPWVRPHAAGQRWLFGVAALFIAVPLAGLIQSREGVTVAADAVAAAAMAVAAGRYRNLPLALGAVVDLAAFEAYLISQAASGGDSTVGYLVALLVGVVQLIIAVVLAAGLMWRRVHLDALPSALVADAGFVAALVLTLLSLQVSGDRLNAPTPTLPTAAAATTSVHVPAAPAVARR